MEQLSQIKDKISWKHIPAALILTSKIAAIKIDTIRAGGVNLKNYGNFLIGLLFAAVIGLMTSGTAYARERDGLNLVIDGYYQDWQDKPQSLETNWDMPQDQRTEDNCRTVSMVHDSEYIYIYLKMAGGWRDQFQPYNYEIQINNSYRFSFRIGEDHGYYPHDGIYPVPVRWDYGGGEWWRGRPIEGAQAMITVDSKRSPDRCELRIPFDALIKVQGWNLEEIHQITMTNPSMFYRPVVSVGSPAGSFLLLAAAGWIYLLSVFKRNKLDFWLFLTGSGGLFLLVMYLFGPWFSDLLSQMTAAGAGLLSEAANVGQSYFEYQLLLVENRDSLLTLFISPECSGMIEIAAYVSLIVFYPVYSGREKLAAALAGSIWIFLSNVIRIFVICLTLYFGGGNLYYIAHTIVGRMIFYGMTILLYFLVFTKAQVIRQRIGTFYYESN